ncbi:hypothetical protein HJG60_008232 [Phyllostomus discolor]|uniref:Uncharacterized protein n=1 Tax=Phyllostomus discolor TaxID=89673 RepID=A0A833Z412_9CHIR|nr:hypothetical protein HJG60_008232 [Phyllostomus discolor]
MEDVSSNFQNQLQPRSLVKLMTREVIQQRQKTVSLCLKAEPEELVVFEDLNIFHSQEECVSLNPTQQLTLGKEEANVGKMMLLVKDGNPEDEDLRENSSDFDEMDCSTVSEKPPDYGNEKRINTFIPKEKKIRNILVTIENDIPLEELSKFVDTNVIALI